MPQAPEVTIVVPVMNEEDNILPLIDAVRDALVERSAWELILVDDGSRDRTRELIAGAARNDARIRLVPLARNYGQSTAMQAGFDNARGQVVVTMDGDLQNDPRDIPLLLDELAKGYDLVAGYRIRRQDRVVTRKIPSWFANRIIRWMTGVSIRDNGCSLKAYRKELLTRMRLYSEMHRFIPALAASTAGARITEVGVRHHARARGESKYGLSRIFRVLADLMAIKMIRSFRLRPLLLFAGLAAGATVLGTLSLAATLVAFNRFSTPDSVSLVFPSISLLFFALALFLMMLGLVGEVAIHEHRRQGLKVLPLMQLRFRK